MFLGIGWEPSAAEIARKEKNKLASQQRAADRDILKKRNEHVRLKGQISTLHKNGKRDEADRLERRCIMLERQIAFMTRARDQTDSIAWTVEQGQMYAQQAEATKGAVLVMSSTANATKPAQFGRLQRDFERAKDSIEFAGEQMEDMFAEGDEERDNIEEEIKLRRQQRDEMWTLAQPAVPTAISGAAYAVPPTVAPVAEMSTPIGGIPSAAPAPRPPTASELPAPPAPLTPGSDAWLSDAEARLRNLNL